MTGGAIALVLGLEKRKPAQLLLRQRAGPRDPGVIARGEGVDLVGLLESRERDGDAIEGGVDPGRQHLIPDLDPGVGVVALRHDLRRDVDHRVGAPDIGEGDGVKVGVVRAHHTGDCAGGMGQPHLHRVQKRALRLIGGGGAKLLARRPTVEEGTADDGHVALVDDVMQDRRERRIGKRGRLAVAEAAGDGAFDDRTARVELRERTAETGGGIVAGGAGLIAVGRQVGVKENLPPQRLKLVRAGLHGKHGRRRAECCNDADDRLHGLRSLFRPAPDRISD